MRALAIPGLLLGLAACAPAAVTAPEPAWTLSDQMQDARRMMIEHVENFIASPDDPMAAGYWDQAVSMAGREDLIYQGAEDGNQPIRPQCADPGPDPLPELVELAGNTSIVIINEAHSRPSDRLFILELAKALNGIGYRTYAAETFSETIADKPGAATNLDDGYYTREPVYARLLEAVRGMGFHLVAYEQHADQAAPADAAPDVRIDSREAAQTENLMRAIFNDDPDAKVFIHVGHSHVAERPIPDENGMRWMAARLKEATGIDPLTISLTDCVASGDAPVLASSGVRPDGTLRPVYTDDVVGLPRVTIRDGRPDYRRRAGDIDVQVPAALLPADHPVLIEARRAGDDDIIVPADRLFLRPGESLPLLLPDGTYDLRSFDKDGLVSGPVTVDVKAPA
ncbi:MAG TPA: hypothetical protein PLR76_13480 [Hyphomonas sp.]|nr:hypothetical protein [Hyphomonas sp.]HPE49410.1 hypothetical protein [Hyphomonas sp.]